MLLGLFREGNADNLSCGRIYLTGGGPWPYADPRGLSKMPRWPTRETYLKAESVRLGNRDLVDAWHGWVGNGIRL